MTDRRFVLAVVLAMLSAPVFADGVTDAFIRCMATQDDHKRLACYDKLGADMAAAAEGGAVPPRARAAKYQKVDLLDLKVDMKQLSGKKVAVEGVVLMLGEMMYLGTEPGDASSVSVNVEKLPREDRKRLRKDCADACGRVQVNGTVQKDALDNFEIAADQIMWK